MGKFSIDLGVYPEQGETYISAEHLAYTSKMMVDRSLPSTFHELLFVSDLIPSVTLVFCSE
jgi:hypothetical protein